MKIKNKVRISMLCMIASFFSFAILAHAEEVKTMTSSTETHAQLPATAKNMPAMMKKEHPKPETQQVLHVEPNGHILVRGILVSSTSSVLTIKSWGTTFTVDTSKAKVAGTVTDLTTFTVGDFIGVSGMLDEANPLMITADVVRNRVQGPKNPSPQGQMMSDEQSKPEQNQDQQGHMMQSGATGMMSNQQGKSVEMKPPQNGMMKLEGQGQMMQPPMPPQGGQPGQMMGGDQKNMPLHMACPPGHKYNFETGVACPTVVRATTTTTQ